MAAEHDSAGVRGVASAIAAGRTTAGNVAAAALERAQCVEPSVHAFACLDAAYVRAAAQACDAAGAHGVTDAPLRGVPIGVKDIIDTADLRTELGTDLCAGRQPARDAACVAQLRAAGAYVFGKTVTTAYAFLDPGPTRNPWNLAHTPGGSSSGSAAAVAAGIVPAAIGTQTNGSVIRPAAFCGIVGFKPTYGLVDFAGAHVFSATFDTLGTFTRSVADAALVASALAPARLKADVVPLASPPRVAFLAAFPWAAPTDHAREALAATAVQLRMAGALVSPLNFPAAWVDADRLHRLIMLYEGAQALGATQARHRMRLTPRVNAALDEGHAIAEAEYRAALAHREQAIEYFLEWLAPYDVVLSPAALGGAPAGLASTGDPGCCTLWSLTGFPAVALPSSFDPAGLPLAIQLAAPRGHDEQLLSAAAWCEQVLAFSPRVAPMQWVK
jgi:Asp-tRNA(Asn)/Glu-tRNA(Gln) amidotransferase A subunit family amidase